MTMVKVAVIGGSGLAEIFDKKLEELKLVTPYGAPSDAIGLGEVAGIKVAFIPRHGRGHIYPPHVVNYRANIWALKELGVERIIAVSTVGSLQERYKPGTLVLTDQYIDFTKTRNYTFYDGGKTYHVSMADPFCPELRTLFYKSATEINIPCHDKGTYVCVEGPRFSTRAESRMFRNFADIIGMTLVPEVQLAREKEICYVNLAMVTDYDVWAEKPVCTEEILKTMERNIANIRRLIAYTLPKINPDRSCECKDTLKNAGV